MTQTGFYINTHLLLIMLKLGLMALAIGLFFLQKVGLYADRLHHPYDKIYKVLNGIFKPITENFKNVKPHPIGRELSLDIVPMILLVIILILINIL